MTEPATTETTMTSKEPAQTEPMSTPVDIPEVEARADGPSGTADTDQPTGDDTGDDATPSDPQAAKVRKVQREARALRGRLQDAEQQRDQLAAQLDAIRRSEIITRATDAGLKDGRDLFNADGFEVTNLLAEDGTVDPEKVTEAVKQVTKDHPHWARARQPYRGLRTVFDNHLDQQVGESDADYEQRMTRHKLEFSRNYDQQSDFSQAWHDKLRG